MTSVDSLRNWNENIWQLFIDSSQQILKAVLLHNGNSKPSILIAHCVHLEETYDSMKILLKAVQYNVHQWNNCGDMKVTGMSMAMQAGSMKFCCLCLWVSCSTAEYYVKCDWEPWKTYRLGKASVQHWMRIRKWDVACHLKFTFCIHI